MAWSNCTYWGHSNTDFLPEELSSLCAVCLCSIFHVCGIPGVAWSWVSGHPRCHFLRELAGTWKWYNILSHHFQEWAGACVATSPPPLPGQMLCKVVQDQLGRPGLGLGPQRKQWFNLTMPLPRAGKLFMWQSPGRFCGHGTGSGNS